MYFRLLKEPGPILQALGTGPATNTRLVVEKNRGGKDGMVFPYTLRLVEAPEKDEDGDPVTTRVVDWLPPGSVEAAPAPDDPWLKSCRRDDQRVAVTRFKRALLEALAEHGIEHAIPSALHVRTSTPIGENEVRTPSADAPTVRMVTQTAVWEAFSLCTPNDPRQTTHSRFTRARDHAEWQGLIQAGNIDGITYLWLTRPEADEG